MADVLKRTGRMTVDLERNGMPMYAQRYYKADVTFTESTHQRVVLGTNMTTPSEVDMAGVATGAVLMVQPERAINVGIDNITNLINLAANGLLSVVGSFTHVYLQNESTTYTATVEILVTD